MARVRVWARAHRKLIVALIGAGITFGVQWAPDNQWITLAVVLATAAGVYQAPNDRPGLK